MTWRRFQLDSGRDSRWVTFARWFKQIVIHLLHPTILVLQFLRALDVWRLLATMLGLPKAVRGLRGPVFVVDLLGGPAA